jgi:hypothetical protein
MTTAAMHRARSILTAARAEVAKIEDQDDAIPWTLLDVDRVITDLDNLIEAEEAHPDAPVFVYFPMQEMSRA